ncbi:MAG: phosphatidylglycerophosphatase A [Methanobacteriaceae archaeon]
MNSNICIKDVSFSRKDNYIVIQREKGLLSISNSYNNDFSNIKTIIMHSVPDKKTPVNPDEYLNKFLENENLPVTSTIALTSADIKHCTIETLDYVTAIISAHNSCLHGAGETCDKNRESNAGSISIILLINKNLNYKALMKAYSKALEAKVSSLWDLDVRSGSWDLATGNNNDTLIAACTGVSNEEMDNDELQYLVGKCVRYALKNAMLKSGFSKNILDFIEGIGIKIEDLLDAGMELCTGVEVSEELRDKLRMQIVKSLEDLNVVSFIIAGIRLEEDYMKHRVEGVNVDDDPAYLYSDEILGMSIANQIAGTKAIFNFKRYDEEKPGIISKLGPVLDDVFAGLVAGCMSKIFEE